jgi:ABC-2 type transport system permease protein
MTIYFDIIRFNFLRFLAYPTEIWAAVAKRAFGLGFLIVFWSIVAKSSHGNISLVPLISYFLVASSIDTLVSAQELRFGGFLGEYIKTGTISTYLVRPLSIIPYMISSSLGERSLGLLLAVITFIIGIAIYPPAGPLAIILFIVFLALAIVISLAINLMVGIFYFYSPEARSFLYTIGHTVKIFSGAMIPIAFFPEVLKKIVLLSPLPGMVFAPTLALHSNNLDKDTVLSLIVNTIWAISLISIALSWWKRAIRNYDAIGI